MNKYPFYNFTNGGLIDKTSKIIGNFSLYKDPLFDNEIKFLSKFSWGCSDNFSYANLRKFCLTQAWRDKLIYQSFNNITHIGIFGNADRQKNSDWIKLEKLALETYSSSWDEFYNRCKVPAKINLNILYATYGLVNNTQIAIYKANVDIESIYWWAKTPWNNSTQDYFTYVNVNYYRIPQDTEYWFAPPPGFIKLPRNIMYPFRIGTTDYSGKGYIRNDNILIRQLFKRQNLIHLPNNVKNNLNSFFLVIFLLGVLFF